jgi:ubiquinone biosynthesis protein
LGQLAASRGDLLPRALVEPLSRIQDRVRPPSRRALRRALVKAYGTPGTWPFALKSWRPIASGSVATVLEACLPGGEALAIKLVRGGVARQIEADLLWLSWLLRMLERHPRLRAVPLTLAFTHLAPLVARQSDMFEEARAHARLLPSVAGMILPTVRVDLTRATALAMELRPCAYRLNDPRVPRAVYQAGCRTVLDALYRMIFVHGFVHCDLHPGNVAFDPEGLIILYDYGLVAELSDLDRSILAGLFTAILNRDPVRMAHEILKSAHVAPHSLDRGKLEEDAEQLLARWVGKPVGEFLVASFVLELFDLQHKHHIRSSPSFAAAIWALTTFEGLVRERFPEMDFQEEARPFLVSHMITLLRPSPPGGSRIGQTRR